MDAREALELVRERVQECESCRIPFHIDGIIDGVLLEIDGPNTHSETTDEALGGGV